MSRIEERFEELKERREGALVGYITAGSPNPHFSKKACLSIITGGVDILELGIPFSDPVADGPTIQRSSQMALKEGTNPKMVMELAKEVTQEVDTPIVLLSYFNPVYKAGLEPFLRMAKESRVDGLIIADLPVEEAVHYWSLARKIGLDTVFLASPTTSESRLKKVLEMTSGFLYLVSIFGVTGARDSIQRYTVDLVKRFRSLVGRKVNLAVGFGISRPEHVKTVIQSGADGAIVGSGFVEILNREDLPIDERLMKLESYASSLKAATKGILTSS